MFDLRALSSPKSRAKRFISKFWFNSDDVETSTFKNFSWDVHSLTIWRKLTDSSENTLAYNEWANRKKVSSTIGVTHSLSICFRYLSLPRRQEWNALTKMEQAGLSPTDFTTSSVLNITLNERDNRFCDWNKELWQFAGVGEIASSSELSTSDYTLKFVLIIFCENLSCFLVVRA